MAKHANQLFDPNRKEECLSRKFMKEEKLYCIKNINSRNNLELIKLSLSDVLRPSKYLAILGSESYFQVIFLTKKI